MKYQFEILNRETCYQGFFRLDRCRIRHELYEGGSHEITRELFERGHAAAVILFDPDLDRLVMVEQFRVGAIDSANGAWMLEFVAGIIEDGEGAVDVVIRESMEEAGCIVSDVEPVSSFILSPGGCSEHIHLFCGRVESSSVGGIHGLADEGENIRVFTVDFEGIPDLLAGGAVTSATTLVGLQWFLLNYEAVRARLG